MDDGKIVKTYKKLCPRHKIELKEKARWAEYDSSNCEKCQELSNVRSLSEVRRLSIMRGEDMHQNVKEYKEFQQFSKKVDGPVDKEYTDSDYELAYRNGFGAAKVKAKLKIQERIDKLARQLHEAQQQDSHQRDVVEKLRCTILELETLKQALGDIAHERLSSSGLDSD